MLVESAIQNISSSVDELEAGTIDWLDLTWPECRTRFARKHTRGGKEVRLLLRLQHSLKHGDLLGHWPNGQLIVVNLLPAQVLVIRPQKGLDSIAAAFQLGNLHVPIELSSDGLLTPHTSEVEAMLSKFQIAFESDRRRFEPTHWPESVRFSPNFRLIRRPAEPPASQ